MRSVERRNHALHEISSKPNKEREREIEREKEKGKDPQLKFPNGLDRNAPREYCDFFYRRFIFGARAFARVLAIVLQYRMYHI